MGVRATVVMSGLVLALAACGSTAQSVKSIDAVPAGASTDVSVPDVTLPGGTLPGGITIPSIPVITIPPITIPGNVTLPGGVTIPGGTIPGFTIPVAPATTRPAATTTAGTAGPPVTDAPAATAAPPAGGTQTVGGDGITMSIPSDWKAAGDGTTVTTPAGLGGASLLQFSSPGGDSISVSSVPGSIDLYKQIFSAQGSDLTVTDTTIDGKRALKVTSTSGSSSFALDFLLVQATSSKVFLVTFVGITDGIKATEDAIFQSIKVSG